jgi:hypothetical protein
MRVAKVNMKPFLPWELHKFGEELDVDFEDGDIHYGSTAIVNDVLS